MTVQRLRLARAFQTFQGRGSVGPRALLSAVIATAALDLADGDPAAAAYFLSDLYRHHVTLAGLPADYLPEGVTRADLAALVEAAASRARRVRSATSAGAKIRENMRICRNMSQGATD